jgi:hypothetical protein
MKTMIYNLQKVMISAIFVLIISSVGSAAAQAHETPVLIADNNSEAILVINEANNSTSGLLTEPSADANLRDLSLEIENWMSDGSYWESDNSSEIAEKDLSETIESWMSNGSYWSVPNHHHNAGARLTHKIKSWMDNGSYWENDEN